MSTITDVTPTPVEQGSKTETTEGTVTQTVTTEVVKTFTQDQINEIVKQRLAEQSQKLTTKFEKELADKLNAALADKDSQVDTLVNTRVTAELTKKQLEVAKAALKAEYSLNDKQLEKLDGETADELKASAEALFSAMRTRTAPVIVAGGGSSSVQATFSRSQLRDFSFYTKNKDAILLAMRENRITDD